MRFRCYASFLRFIQERINDVLRPWERLIGKASCYPFFVLIGYVGHVVACVDNLLRRCGIGYVILDVS